MPPRAQFAAAAAKVNLFIINARCHLQMGPWAANNDEIIINFPSIHQACHFSLLKKLLFCLVVNQMSQGKWTKKLNKSCCNLASLVQGLGASTKYLALLLTVFFLLDFLWFSHFLIDSLDYLALPLFSRYSSFNIKTWCLIMIKSATSWKWVFFNQPVNGVHKYRKVAGEKWNLAVLVIFLVK